MAFMSVTLETFQDSIGLLNDFAPGNMKLMSVTPEVSQAPMSSSKSSRAWNKRLRFRMVEMFHAFNWPYCEINWSLESVSFHRSKAFLKCFQLEKESKLPGSLSAGNNHKQNSQRTSMVKRVKKGRVEKWRTKMSARIADVYLLLYIYRVIPNRWKSKSISN